MPCSYSFDSDKHLLILTREGKVTADELADSFNEAACRDEFKLVTSILIDHSKSDFANLTGESVARIALLYRQKLEGRNIQIAVIAPDDLRYGLSRLFEANIGIEPVHVFKSEEEAMTWLQTEALTKASK